VQRRRPTLGVALVLVLERPQGDVDTGVPLPVRLLALAARVVRRIVFSGRLPSIDEDLGQNGVDIPIALPPVALEHELPGVQGRVHQGLVLGQVLVEHGVPNQVHVLVVDHDGGA